MIQHRYYDEPVEGLRPARWWKTWLLWAIFVLGYTGWTYLQATAVTSGTIDWTGFWIHIGLVALIGLVVKTWIDLRVEQFRGT